MKSGIVTVSGRANSGKSTLVNSLVGEIVSIISPKPQTTRNRIKGILNDKEGQIVFVDCPGFSREKTLLDSYMQKTARDSLFGVDLILVMLDGVLKSPISDQEDRIFNILRNQTNPIFALINKVDLISSKSNILPVIEELSHLNIFKEIIPMSAVDKNDVNNLLSLLWKYIPEGKPLYPPDIYTDQTERFLAGEIIREYILNHTVEEIPHCSAVEIEEFSEKKNGITVHASLIVERDSQKRIIIGKGGKMIKNIGSSARKRLSQIFGCPVNLFLFVKVKKDWRDNPSILRDLSLK